MSNIDLRFIDSTNRKNYIKVVSHDGNNEKIVIHGIDENGEFVIYLDKPTAIKFAKTLRTEINKTNDPHRFYSRDEYGPNRFCEICGKSSHKHVD